MYIFIQRTYFIIRLIKKLKRAIEIREMAKSAGGFKVKANMDLLSSQNELKELSSQMDSGDITIELDDKSQYKVHKFLLAKHSLFFLKLFSYESDAKVIQVKDVSSQSFVCILDWIYKVNQTYHQFILSLILTPSLVISDW